MRRNCGRTRGKNALLTERRHVELAHPTRIASAIIEGGRMGVSHSNSPRNRRRGGCNNRNSRSFNNSESKDRGQRKSDAPSHNRRVCVGMCVYVCESSRRVRKNFCSGRCSVVFRRIAGKMRRSIRILLFRRFSPPIFSSFFCSLFFSGGTRCDQGKLYVGRAEAREFLYVEIYSDSLRRS